MRLVFFGDSFTYGHGLDDCLCSENKPGNCPSQLGWAAQLADMFGTVHVNLSKPGCSNQYIFKLIRETEFQANDLVIVQWSFVDRDFLLMSDESVRHIGNWMTDFEAKNYYKAHSDLDITRRSILTIEHAALWLANKNLAWLFLSNIQITAAKDLITDAETNIWFKSGQDYAADGSHPGQITNTEWAKKIKFYIDTGIPFNRPTGIPVINC